MLRLFQRGAGWIARNTASAPIDKRMLHFPRCRIAFYSYYSRRMIV